MSKDEIIDESMDFWRQMDILSPSDIGNIGITVIGAGGIGSRLIVDLAKMGFKIIKVYDGDLVERHNLPNQYYRKQDIGRLKVIAIGEICYELTGTKITAIPEYYTNQPLSGIVISCVDDIDVRKQIWSQVRFKYGIDAYIEARMAAQVFQINTVYPYDTELVSWYETTLFDKSKAYQAPCTERAIMYNVSIIAGYMGNLVKKIIKNDDNIPRKITFDCVNWVLIHE